MTEKEYKRRRVEIETRITCLDLALANPRNKELYNAQWFELYRWALQRAVQERALLERETVV